MVQQHEATRVHGGSVGGTKWARVLGIEIVIAVLCAIAAVWCWNHGVRTTVLQPNLPNSEPVGVTYYSGGWITLAAILAAVAGAVAVDIVGRLVEPSRSVPTGGMLSE